MHTCENPIDHPVATDTTTTTTTTTTTSTKKNNKYNSDITNDKYVQISLLFSTFDVDDWTTTIDIDNDNRQTPTTNLDIGHDSRQPTASDDDDDDDDDNGDRRRNMHIGSVVGNELAPASPSCPEAPRQVGRLGCPSIDSPGEATPCPRHVAGFPRCALKLKTQFDDREVERSSSRPVRAPLPGGCGTRPTSETEPGGILYRAHHFEPGRLLPQHPILCEERNAARL